VQRDVPSSGRLSSTTTIDGICTFGEMRPADVMPTIFAVVYHRLVRPVGHDQAIGTIAY
jgi:hypothetical protein